MSDKKPTKAQLKFLRMHRGPLSHSDGFLSKWNAHATYDFIGRVRDAGWIEIIPGKHSSWPFGWAGTKLTAAGLKVLNA